MTTKIVGTGSYVPERVVFNDDLAKMMEASNEWIQSRTGIRERGTANCEGISELAARVAAAAMENAGIEASEIGIIMLTISSPDNCFSNGACEVQAAIGVENAMAFDISTTCAGPVYALNTMHAFLKSGLYQTGLVIGADMMGKLTDRTDRGTCVLFGDGADVVVVRAEESEIVRMMIKADGKKSHVLTCETRTSGNFPTGKTPELGYTTMDGQGVFRFTVRKVSEYVQQVLGESGTNIEEIKYSVMHQASYRISKSIAKQLKVSIERTSTSMDRYGNTSGASVPTILDELSREGKLQPGDKLILSGFGAEPIQGAILIEWQ